MPVRVSYKKQFAVMTMLLLTFLIVIELGVNFWLYNIYRCGFEDSEIFQNVDPEMNRKKCLESLEYDFSNQRIACATGTMAGRDDVAVACGGHDKKVMYYNSEGFRGPEFTKDKPENTFRILTVGGSSTFGAGVVDNETYPYYLQELFDETNLDFKVKVINVGIPGAWSDDEVTLILTGMKSRKNPSALLAYDPDLFIVLDGANDLHRQLLGIPEATPTSWKNRWNEICELGKQLGFETIITIQPIVNAGKKILTHQEYEASLKKDPKYLEPYPFYVEQLKELKKHCTLTADLRDIFDDVKEPIYFDFVHAGPRGNQIISETMYSLSLPIVEMKGVEGLEHKSSFGSGATADVNVRLNSNEDENGFIEKVYVTSRDIFSQYKTLKVYSLIFE